MFLSTQIKSSAKHTRVIYVDFNLLETKWKASTNQRVQLSIDRGTDTSFDLGKLQKRKKKRKETKQQIKWRGFVPSACHQTDKKYFTFRGQIARFHMQSNDRDV